MGYDPRYVRFIQLFNEERDYFECHEVMEDLWMDEAQDPFWQGLLQVAVALFHARNGNIGGAAKLMASAMGKLSRHADRNAGIDVGKLLEDGERYLARLAEWGDSPFPFEPMDISVTDPELARALSTGPT